MKAIIVEDEAIAARRLKRMLDDIDIPEINVLRSMASIEETAEYLLSNPHPDLIFLDIHLEDGNSFELFDIIDDLKSSVIFTTAYNEYASYAFRKDALDYLLKPIKSTELLEAINKKKKPTKTAINKIKSFHTEYKSRFLIRLGSKIQLVKTDDIAYLYSENKLTYFVLKDGKRYPSDFRLQEIYEQLDPETFFRVNRQVITAIDSIKEIINYSKSRVKLKVNPPFKEDIVVSTETSPKFKKWLDR